MRLLIVILTFLNIMSCSTNKKSSGFEYDLDELEFICYRWSTELFDINKDTIHIHFYAIIDKHGHCQLLEDYYKYHYYEFDIDPATFQKILESFSTINDDTLLLTDYPFSGPYPNINYLLHKNHKTKILSTIGSYKYSPDSCYVDFYNYMLDIIKNKNYKPSVDTIEISNKLNILIKGLYDRKIISFGPPPDIIRNKK